MVNHPCVLQDSASIVKLSLLNKPTAGIVGLVQKSYKARPQTVFLFHGNSHISSTLSMAVKIIIVQAVCINVFVLLTGKYTSPVVIPNLPIEQISTDSYILRRVKVTIF